MLSSFSQLVTLVLYGNAFVQGQQVEIDETSHTTFKLHKAKFYQLKKTADGGRLELLYADNANAWFTQLKQQGVYAIQLLNKMIYGYKPTTCISTEKDRPIFTDTDLSVLFIETMHPGGSDLWQGRDLRLPYISYLRVASNQPNRVLKLRPIVQVKQEVTHVIKDLLSGTQRSW